MMRVRGLIALGDGNLHGAAAAFDQALRVAPYDADLWVSIASMRFTGGQQALAVAAAARTRGCSRVYWITHETNAVAQSLYDKVVEEAKTGSPIDLSSLSDEQIQALREALD